jgi:hypothetical protein
LRARRAPTRIIKVLAERHCTGIIASAKFAWRR